MFESYNSEPCSEARYINDQLTARIEALESALIILTQSLDLTCRSVAALEAKVSTLEADHKELIERIDCLTGESETLI